MKILFPSNFISIKCLLIGLYFFVVGTTHLQATWSIVIIDSTSQEMGMAGASCTHNVFGIAKYITDKGVLIAQAVSDRRCWLKGVNMLYEGYSQKEILDTITHPSFDAEVAFRQYALVTFDEFDSPQTFSGDSIKEFTRHAFTAPGISVQGNTLANEKVLKMVFDAVVLARRNHKSVEESLLIGLEVGSKCGGDRRCGSQTATSAFIQVAKPNDDRSSAYLDIRIAGVPEGGQNPIKLLREEYEKAKPNLIRNKGTRILIVPKE